MCELFVVLYNTRQEKGNHLQEKDTSIKKDTKQIWIICTLITTVLEIIQSHTLTNDWQTSLVLQAC